MNKKLLYLVIVVAVIAVGFFGYKFVNEKMIKVGLGLARQTFPFKDYTGEELEKLFPQIKNADVSTRVTPEETYAKFREALKNNNLEMAIAQLSPEAESYQRNVDILNKAYEEGKFGEAYNGYPEKIEKESMYESIASFYYVDYSDGHNLKQFVGFQKNSEGDWQLSSL